MKKYMVKRNTLSGVEVFVRTADMAWFQEDEENLEYREYREWIEQGNEPGEWTDGN